jgi:glycosyltransferase involved in cell wall biosynthesis
MNILFISNDPSLFTEGSAVRRRMRAYAEEVQKQGGVLYILSRASSTQVVVDLPCVLHGVQVGKIRSLLVLPRIARYLIRTEDIAVVSAQDPFEHGWIARRAVRHTSAKLHVQVHTDFLSPWFTQGMSGMAMLNRIRVWMAGATLCKASGIRVVSERIRASLEKQYGSRIPAPTVLPIATSREAIEAVPLPTNYGFTCITVGRLEKEKNIENILHALAQVVTTHPEIGLLIVGEGRERFLLEQLVARLKLSAHVTFLGSRTDARGLMKSADLVIQMSSYEGYGLTLIEAVLSGTPLITTDVGVVGDVIPSNGVAFTSIGDVSELAQHIRSVIESRETALQKAVSAKSVVEENLSHTDSSPRAIIADMLRLV